MDFMMVSTKSSKRGTVEIFPKFIVKKSKDLMIKGGYFYAVWDESKGLWSTDQDDVTNMVDRELDAYAETYKANSDDKIKVLHMWDSDSGTIDRWHKYCQKQMPDTFKPLNQKLIFANDPVCREDYASKRLPYNLEEGDISAWDELVGRLYSQPERKKIEWAIGSVVSGDSKKIQKFVDQSYFSNNRTDSAKSYHFHNSKYFPKYRHYLHQSKYNHRKIR